MSYRPYNAITVNSLSDNQVNNTGNTLEYLTPVRINISGDLDTIDISQESAMGIIGIVASNISDSSSGEVISTGKVFNVSLDGDFGDIIYVSKTGGLTNLKPSIGVGGFEAGDFCISIGVLAKNQSNPLQKDLILSIDTVGQL
jgi:hypothetical protein